jgi:broad specificity phosphatase PhoE
MDIFLVRHGEAAASWGEAPDPGLSDRGRRQAEEAADFLMQHIGDDTLLLSSPLQRAVDTAEPLARRLRRPVQKVEAFREIPSPVALAQRQQWLRQFMQQHWQGQAKDLVAWRTATLQNLLVLKQPAVVFTHFLVINAVVGQTLGRPETLYFWPDNGSITRLCHNGAGLELLALGKEIETLVN